MCSHHLVSDLSARARRDGHDLRQVVAAGLPRELADRLPPAEVMFDPARYLGESATIVDSAVSAWHDRDGTP
jgi:hypothetical protein